MTRRRRSNRALVIALYINAGLLASLVIAVATRGSGRLPWESAAFGQQSPMPIAGGSGRYLMPGQLAPNVWGCYIMDVDAQTLAVYRYDPVAGPGGRGEVRLAAARSFAYDLQLRQYNVGAPTPSEVEQLVALERDQRLRPDDGGATTRPTIPQ